MKRTTEIIVALFLLLALFGCSAQKKVDYETAEAFEAALNAGEDVSGKTVTFTAQEIKPDSAFGYNIFAGEHLNFCSPTNPKVKEGDTVTVTVTEAYSFLGSWIISYTKD